MANTESAVKFFGPASQALDTNKDPFSASETGSVIRVTGGGVGGSGAPQPDPAPQDPIWEFASTDTLRTNWNKSFPYQLLILRKASGSYSIGNVVSTFTLPIPPQALNISTPFAINTSVTMGGILEEHNGAPLRMIALSGTTGVLPLRGTVTEPESHDSLAAGIFKGIFAGTLNSAINAGANVVNVATQISNFGRSQGTTPSNVYSDSDFGGDLGKTTGYFQFLLLERFLQSYLNRKKIAEGRDLRLAFAVWKEKKVYLVTPVTFDVIRSASSPLEYSYNLQFKAWRQLTLDDSQAKPYQIQVVGKDPNKFAAVINILEGSRRVLAGGQDILKSVRADIQNALFTPLRQAVLFSKELMGLKESVADFPKNLAQDLKQPLLELFGEQANKPPLTQIPNLRALEQALKSLSIESGVASSRAGVNASTQQESQGDASAAVKALQNPDDHFEFFSQISVGDLNLRPQTVRKMEEERRSVRSLRRDDFESFRDSIQEVLSNFSDFVGAGNSTYTRVYGLPSRTALKEPTDDDWEIIHALSQASQAMDALAVSSTINQDVISSIDYVAGLASRSGIAFRVPRSKFAVPFPYGHTLEQLSARYLKDPNRWHEIAALNGLRAPYVDETGFTLKLLVNGNANQVVVADGSRFYSGQQIWIGSTSVRRERRRVQKVDVLGPGQVVLILDGAPDLQKFAIVAQAEVQAFLPDTVNSQQQIYIPSEEDPGEDDFLIKKIPGVDYFDPLVHSGGIDLLLTGTGDFVITPDGDSRLAVGLTNLIQKVRLVFGTPIGSLPHHPEYGIGIRAGTSTADLSATDILAQAKSLFRDDPGFSGVESASVNKSGNHVQIGLGIGISGTSQVVPVFVDIRR